MLVKEHPEIPPQEIPFYTHGPLSPDAGSLYISRKSDDQLEEVIAKRDYAAVIGPRLSGKSSMLLRQVARLSKIGLYVPVYVALGKLAGIGDKEWYARLHQEIAQQTNGLIPLPDKPITHALAWGEALVKAVEATPGKTFVIMLDQVEATPETIGTRFFPQVREMFVNRWYQVTLKRIVFVLAGRFVPDDLIQDPAISPFRVAVSVTMDDADAAGVAGLVELLANARRRIAHDVPSRVFEWTDGDVYLTHRLCAMLAEDVREGTIQITDVDRVARRQLGEDDLFRRMWSQIQKDPQVALLVDTLLEHREQVRFTTLQRHIMVAWLEGAIKPDASGNCMLHSLIHENVLYSLLSTRTGHPRPPRHHRAHDDQTVLRERYRLVHQVYDGLFSVVYRGLDMMTGDQVAVKQLNLSSHQDETALYRFKREAEVLKVLRHPNIVRLLDAFSEDGSEYIVMEFVYGGSLYDRLNREGRLPLRTALDIAMKLASALDHAHQQGIVHRDVKPANTMLTPDLQPLLADFGIARLNFHAGLTQPHSIIGTPAYLSPEGVRGDIIDAAGDIWALGVMMFEMLAGTLPFVGRSKEAMDHAILEKDPPDLRAIRPDVPEAVVGLLKLMLVKDPAQRLLAAEVHTQLRAILTQL